jgi:hypothetical protein
MDTLDLKSMVDVVDFMKTVKNHRYVVLVISDSYLRSENCMIEARELINEGKYDSKGILVIVSDPKNIFEEIDGGGYVNYWESKKETSEDELRNCGSAMLSIIADKIQCYGDIINILPKFLRFIKNKKCMLFDELKKTDYRELLDHVSVKRKSFKKKNY